MTNKPLKLIKVNDNTLKCICRADFVITHAGNVECASCGTSYGQLTDKPNIRLKADVEGLKVLTDSALSKAVQTINDAIAHLEANLENTMQDSSDTVPINDLSKLASKLSALL